LSASVELLVFTAEPGLAGFIGADGSGGDKWSYKTCQLQSNHDHHQQTNTFIQAGCPSCCQTNRVKAPKAIASVLNGEY